MELQIGVALKEQGALCQFGRPQPRTMSVSHGWQQQRQGRTQQKAKLQIPGLGNGQEAQRRVQSNLAAAVAKAIRRCGGFSVLILNLDFDIFNE